MKHLWHKWKIFSTKVLKIQTKIILTVLYWLILAPTAIIYKLVSDPLSIKEDVEWSEKANSNTSTMESMKRQY